MRTHEIRNHELLEPKLLVGRIKAPHKFLISVVVRLPHHLKHFIAHMLRRQTKLPRNMILRQLIYEFVGVLIKKYIIAVRCARTLS